MQTPVREAVFLTLLRFIVVLLLRGNHKKAALVREAAKQTDLVARRLVGALWTGSEVAKKQQLLFFLIFWQIKPTIEKNTRNSKR